MPGNILEMRGIAKCFGAVKALKNVDLFVRPGEIHAICGENGAGKSTLMKILDGFHPSGSYSGEIMLDAQPLRMRSPADASRNGIAMIYQEISIHGNLSVAENLFVGRVPSRLGILSSRRMCENARKALSEIGLNTDVSMLASRLNTSQQQLLMIARALIQNPRILVLDEPTSALTVTESESLFRILGSLHERGVTCIYISHKLDEVFRLADRITVLRDGETINTFERSAFQPDQVIEAMVGREIQDLYPKECVPAGDVALEVKNLSVAHPTIRGRKLIDSIEFSVKQGEIMGIAGLVGSGRSEALRTIYGWMKGSSADIAVHGKRVRIRSPKDALANGIALLTEDRRKTGLILPVSVAENITLASLRMISRGSIVNSSTQRRLASGMASDLQIKLHSIYAPANQLSGGNQQKVVIAKWMLTKPRVFLMDEPTRGIDVGAKSELYRLIGKLAAEGTAIIMVSSELQELLEMCDRFIVLADGRIVDAFSKDEASESRVMMAATGMKGA